MPCLLGPYTPGSVKQFSDQHADYHLFKIHLHECYFIVYPLNINFIIINYRNFEGTNSILYTHAQLLNSYTILPSQSTLQGSGTCLTYTVQYNNSTQSRERPGEAYIYMTCSSN